MAGNNDVFICDRLIQAAGEFRQHATRLAQLEQAAKAKESELVGLDAKIGQAKTMAAEVEALDQKIREKRSELASLDAELQRKHLLHGKVDSDLRDLRKRISGDPTHA